jgi:hypothetical protein
MKFKVITREVISNVFIVEASSEEEAKHGVIEARRRNIYDHEHKGSSMVWEDEVVNEVEVIAVIEQ